MLITYDHQIFSLQRHGGVSRYFAELTNELAGGYDEVYVELALKYTNNEYLLARDGARYSNLFNAREFRGKRRLFDIVNKRYSIRSLKRQRFDLFHPTYYDPYFLKYVGNKAFVLTVHDMIHERFSPKNGERNEVVRSKRLLAQKASRVIAVSQSTKDDLIDFHSIDPDKIQVIHLGYNPPANEQLDKPAVPGRYLLFVGKRDGYKNFTKFIEAAAPLLREESSLFVFSAGGGSFSAGEVALLESKGLSGKVIQKNVTDKELAALYQHALAFIYPSQYEGFGIPILESFASSCPVAASNTSSLPEVAGNAALYFSPGDTRDITEALYRITHDVGLRESLRTKGLGQLKRFSWKKMADETRELYASLV